MAIESINGHSYNIIRDGDGKVISQVIADTPAPVALVELTKFQFRSLFTFAERVEIDDFANNTNLTTDQKRQLKTLQYDLSIAESINLQDPLTIQGVQLLETLGLIAPGRASQVLAGQNPPTS